MKAAYIKAEAGVFWAYSKVAGFTFEQTTQLIKESVTQKVFGHLNHTYLMSQSHCIRKQNITACGILKKDSTSKTLQNKYFRFYMMKKCSLKTVFGHFVVVALQRNVFVVNVMNSAV